MRFSPILLEKERLNDMFTSLNLVVRNVRKMTTRQYKYVFSLAKCGNKRQAVIDAGYKIKNRRDTDSFVYWLNRNERVQTEIKRLLEKSGFTDEIIARRWQDAIDAGWGVGAKHSDCVYSLEMALKMKHLI